LELIDPLVTLTFLAIMTVKSTLVIVWSILDGLTCILMFDAVILKQAVCNLNC
jgi:hypothetical protein